MTTGTTRQATSARRIAFIGGEVHGDIVLHGIIATLGTTTLGVTVGDTMTHGIMDLEVGTTHIIVGIVYTTAGTVLITDGTADITTLGSTVTTTLGTTITTTTTASIMVTITQDTSQATANHTNQNQATVQDLTESSARVQAAEAEDTMDHATKLAHQEPSLPKPAVEVQQHPHHQSETEEAQYQQQLAQNQQVQAQ